MCLCVRVLCVYTHTHTCRGLSQGEMGVFARVKVVLGNEGFQLRERAAVAQEVSAKGCRGAKGWQAAVHKSQYPSTFTDTHSQKSVP